MKNAASLTIDEFRSRLEAHEIFYLTGTNGTVYLKLTYADGFLLGHVGDGIEGFLDTADSYIVSSLDDRIIYFSTEGKVTLMIDRRAWEVKE